MRIAMLTVPRLRDHFLSQKTPRLREVWKLARYHLPGKFFFNTSRGQIPLPWLGSNDALPLATRMETRLP